MDYFVLAEREIVLGFMLVGVKGKIVTNRSSALDAFNMVTGQSRQVSDNIGFNCPKVLIVTEDVADMLSSELKDWQMKGKSPLVVEIPGINGHIEGRKTLTDAIREAVGINV